MSGRRPLGRGLDVLLESRTGAGALGGAQAEAVPVPVQMPVDALRPGRYQPRQRLAEDRLAELADSMREQGVLQPLLVRAVEDGGGRAYEIVAGERRWRAAKMAGLASVPVIVRELDDQSALAVALIENVQREDLNPIDQARSLRRLADEFALTHEEVARAVGRSRASVSNFLRLLDLNDEVKDLLAAGGIDMGHARALLSLDSVHQAELARKAHKRRLSVRQVEQAVSRLLAAAEDARDAAPDADLQTRWLQQQIAQELGQDLKLRPGKDGRYTLQIDFDGLPQLHETLERLQSLVERIRDAAGPRAREATRRR